MVKLWGLYASEEEEQQQEEGGGGGWGGGVGGGGGGGGGGIGRAAAVRLDQLKIAYLHQWAKESNLLSTRLEW